jgi:hypothetical protein
MEFGRRNRAYAEQHFDRHTILTGQERFMLEGIERVHHRGAAA